MVFWVPRPSVLLGKDSIQAEQGHFTKRHSEMLSCLHAGIQSCHQHQKMGKPKMRGTHLRGGTDVANYPSVGYLQTRCVCFEVTSSPLLSPSLPQLAMGVK